MKQTATEDPASDGSGLRGSRGSSEWAGAGEMKQSMATVTRLSNAYWGSWIKGYKEAATALGYRTNVQLNHGKPEKQLQQVKASISNGVDIITGQAFTNADSPPIAKAAVDAGVPLVLCWTIADWFTPQDAGEEFVQYFMPNAVNNGYAAAKALFESIDGCGRIVQIEGVRGHAANAGRTAGLEKALAEYPDLERLALPQQGQWVQSEARNVMADYVTQFGDAIDGVFGQNDDIALGALAVAEEHDIDINVVGINGTPDVLQLIDEGKFTASVSALGPWQGGWSVVKAHDFVTAGDRMTPNGCCSTTARSSSGSHRSSS